jgi:hypothetical protein
VRALLTQDAGETGDAHPEVRKLEVDRLVGGEGPLDGDAHARRTDLYGLGRDR